MHALPLILATAILLPPDRPLDKPATANTSWVGKTVYPRGSPMYLDEGAEPGGPMPAKKGPALNLISYRVYAERADHIQVKTREGQVGWLRKADVVTSDDAIAFFTKEIEKNPKDLNAYNRRAAVFRARGDLDAALKDATAAINIRPSAALHNNRALIWQSKKDYDKALEDYAHAFNLMPQYPLGLVNRATLWQAQRDYDKAIDDTTKAIQFQPQLPNAYRTRGVALHSKKEYDKAVADFTRALEIDPKSSQLRADRAGSHVALKNYPKALDDFNEALKLEPSNAVSAAAAAMWLATCPDDKYRDGKRALQIAEQAHSLDRSSTQALQALAAAHAEVGQFTEAVRWQEHALGDAQLKNSKDAQARLELYRNKKPYRRE
jgi:tetratricopeptide (TPR) repeat protein